MAVIAVDLDEVLSDTLVTFVEFHNREYGTSLTHEDFFSYRFEDVLQIPTDRIVTRILEFYLQDSNYIQPVLGAKPVLQALKEKCNLIIVTARVNALEAVTREWVDREFAGIFDAIYFAHNVHIGCARKAKHAYCLEHGATVMIDDSVEYLEPCTQHGVRALLFDRRWNQNHAVPAIERVRSWQDIGSLLLEASS